MSILSSVVHVCVSVCRHLCAAVAELIHDVTCAPGAQQGALLLTTEHSKRSSATGTGFIIQKRPKKSKYRENNNKNMNRRLSPTLVRRRARPTGGKRIHLPPFCDRKGTDSAVKMNALTSSQRVLVCVRYACLCGWGGSGEILPICCALHHSLVLYYEWWPL